LANVHTIAAVHSALLRSASTLSSSRDWCRTTDAATWLQHVTDLLEAAGGSESVVSKMVDQDACTLVVSVCVKPIKSVYSYYRLALYRWLGSYNTARIISTNHDGSLFPYSQGKYIDHLC
jgi:hypothetical protein